MMAEEHDNTAASGAQEATEIYPFASGYPQQTGTARARFPTGRRRINRCPTCR